jgi:hypothetical protein
MRSWAFVFMLVGSAAAAIALLQPGEQSMLVQRNNIRSMMAKHGYVQLPNANMGNAVTVMKFSSSTCDDVRVLPVSVLFQESVLLKELSTAGDTHTFVYRDKRWENIDSAADHAATSHLSQKFWQMFRVVPSPALDTMLYIVAPKKCGAATLFDWSGFWTSQA